MPLRQKGSNAHKEMIINCLKLVMLCVFVPLWLNYTFRRKLKIELFKFILSGCL